MLRYAGIGLLLAVLTAGPFFRGLFFWTELLAALAALGLGFGLWLAGRRLGGQDSGLPGGWTGVALLALLAIYLLQFAWAVFPRGNLDWTLRVAGAWLAYAMLRAEAGPGLRRWLGWLFVLSAPLVGVVGFLEFTGYFAKDAEMAKVLSLVGISDRMFTSFQYHNTAAAYFLAAMFAAAGLGLEDRKPWKITVVTACMSFLMISFLFTASRGALITLPFGLVLFFLGLERGNRWPALLMLVVAALPLVAVMQPVGAASASKAYAVAFRYLALATLAGAAGGLATGFYLRLPGRVQAALAATCLVAVAGAFALFRPALPKQALRLKDINFRTVNVVLRIIYDEDALKMAADQPLGRGGWGWDRGYRQYQQFNYTARETHNHYAQTAVEAGWAGLAALLTALLTALWAAWRARRENPLGWALASGAGLMAAHSLIEFNLSFGVIWLLLWSLLAASATPVPPVKWPRVAVAGGAVAAVAVGVLAGLLGIGSAYSDKATALAEAKDPEGAAVMARQAVRFDPLLADPLEILGDPTSLERAVQLDPYHSGHRFRLAVSLQLRADYHGALREAEAALKAQPMVSAYYTKVAELQGLLLIQALHEGDLPAARQMGKNLLALGQAFTARKAVADPLQHLWNSPKLRMDDLFKLRYGQGLFLAGDRASAEPLLKEAAKSGLLGSEAHVWLYAIYEQRGDTKAMAELATKPWIRFRQQNPVFKAISSWK